MRILLRAFTMMCFFTVFGMVTGLNVEVQAQSEKLGDEEIQLIKQHQFYLDKPAISIERLQYEKEETPIKGELSGDGKRVIMDGYTKRGRVSVMVHYADGTSEKVSRSSCFIDPVIPL